MAQKKVILVIMDGWGLGKVASADAIQNANVPFTRSLYGQYPHTSLVTCGEAVGLPEGQMGNSEVGHLNLGAGRIVYQELQRINAAIKNGSFAQNQQLQQAIQYAKAHNKPLHLLGLVSDGGVHSHISHLEAILDACHNENLQQVFVHAFTDGRDVDPHSGLDFILRLQQKMEQTTGKIATVCGRYYAMDRDNRWERIKIAYDAMVHGCAKKGTDAADAVEESYKEQITDEFIRPVVLVDAQEQPLGLIRKGDAVLCFNFRTDRCREITIALTQQSFPEQKMQPLSLHYTTMTEYDKTFRNVYVIFETDNLNNTLGEVLEQNGLTQLRAAETEKYPHVTFFFSGGRETAFTGEKRILIPSPRVATYDQKPEMSAYELTEALLPEIRNRTFDFCCLNYANTDMVGHTGVWPAAIKAAETVDQCVEKIVTAGLENDYCIFLTADHGNSDYMINEDGSPNTAHTLNPVPFMIIDRNWKGTLKPGKLADIAPTILTMMGLPVPAEMTGTILITPP